MMLYDTTSYFTIHCFLYYTYKYDIVHYHMDGWMMMIDGWMDGQTLQYCVMHHVTCIKYIISKVITHMVMQMHTVMNVQLCQLYGPLIMLPVNV